MDFPPIWKILTENFSNELKQNQIFILNTNSKDDMLEIKN